MMHKECKGCKDEKTFCAKQFIEDRCPCRDCLVKSMCRITCDLLNEFVIKNIEEFICGKWLYG